MIEPYVLLSLFSLITGIAIGWKARNAKFILKIELIKVIDSAHLSEKLETSLRLAS